AALDKNDALQALRILSFVSTENRTPTTHALVLRAVKGASTGLESPLLSPLLQSFLAKFSQVDAEVHGAYLSELVQIMRDATDVQRTDIAEHAFDTIRLLRADPAEENDRLRFRLAIAYFDKGLEQTSQETLKQMRTGLTWGERLHGMFHGLFIPLWL